MKKISTLSVIGVGLIGGSFALALKRRQCVDKIIGVVRDQQTGRRAVHCGAIDEFTLDIAQATVRSEVILLATPVGAMPQIFHAIAPHLKSGALVMDAGSTKVQVVNSARQALRTHCADFVPSHPIAGRELSGVEAAAANLFDDQRVVLTPLPETDRVQIERARSLWETCGARVSELSPEAHDTIFALVSHLPHALAYTLVWQIANRADAAELFAYSAGGFRDFTRIAASHPAMWRDIFLDNRAALLQALKDFGHSLDHLRQAVDRGDGEELQRFFMLASKARKNLHGSSSAQ